MWAATVNAIDMAHVDPILDAETHHGSTCIPETSRDLEAANNQYLREPYHAICDSTVSIYIPGVFNTLAVSKSFNILTSPSGAIHADEDDTRTHKSAKPMENTLKSTGKAPMHGNNAPDPMSNVPTPSSAITHVWPASHMRTMSLSKQPEAGHLAQAMSISAPAVTPEGSTTSTTASMAAHLKGHDIRQGSTVHCLDSSSC